MNLNIEKTIQIGEEIQQKILATQTKEELQKIKKECLGKGGIISQIFRQTINLNNQKEKKDKIKLINEWRKKLLTIAEKKEQELTEKEINQQLLKEKIDITLEGKNLPWACLHPLTQLIKRIYDIFLRLGYQIVESPEVETEENNFTKLNMPFGHPARDMQDTFYLSDGLLLRTHTTNTQSRILSKNPNTELKIISAGKVYRRDDDDATHTHQFTQVDCFVTGKDISFSHLKGTLELLMKELFGEQQIIRFRPSYFPFTEPSVEVDAACLQCQQKGCEVCKRSGWVEIAGAGLIHPQVLQNCGFDIKIYSGFAFAFGLERLLMIKYGIENIRNFYLNDVRFLQQFV
ncbi:phenylalanine--tRNA ligase subunit alpha [endosymbiont GvMRE of Glomus versiforme]|uniref:phenylalanine--tRNA ligase subunit alpha n=1 Tax=endosymbiont GvMRE of Glomus versiforme TaxID=2039283 RepID=UPI000EB92C3F|nr:phenylalanine--tRNA ligase subunit alpha [endosymbiont GvMRE of Glomus versiforme]RHZ36880.1 Phenylalanine--tRNA ligase alpha subunit [endosymbiont GvMRE of Glomus versiforme]